MDDAQMKHLLLMLLFVSLPVNAEWSFGIDLYGRSYHHNLPQGERRKLNEANTGWGVHGAYTTGHHRFVIETGTYLNSYYDQAYWVGGQYNYRLFKYLEPGIMVRHWETEHGTYPEKPFTKYAMVSIPITDNFRTSFIVRSAGYIAFLSIDF